MTQFQRSFYGERYYYCLVCDKHLTLRANGVRAIRDHIKNSKHKTALDKIGGFDAIPGLQKEREVKLIEEENEEKKRNNHSFPESDDILSNKKQEEFSNISVRNWCSY